MIYSIQLECRITTPQRFPGGSQTKEPISKALAAAFSSKGLKFLCRIYATSICAVHVLLLLLLLLSYTLTADWLAGGGRTRTDAQNHRRYGRKLISCSSEPEH